MTGGWPGALDRLQKAGIDAEDIPGMTWHGEIGGCKPATATSEKNGQELATATSEKNGQEPATDTSEKNGQEPARLTSTLFCSLGFFHLPFCGLFC